MMLDATFLLRLYANIRLTQLAREDPAATQARQLLGLVRRAQATRFGQDHGFARIRSVADYQARVPLRRYGDLWEGYWKAGYPVLDDVTWPGRIPYFAFTSGTTSGSAKYIPVSRDMVAANKRAALDALVHHIAAHPASHVLGGKSFILGGSTDLVQEAPGVLRGDLSGIAAKEVPRWARPYSSPPVELALEADWEAKIDRLARLAAAQDIRSLSGTPSWVLVFLERVARLAGRPPAEIFPRLELYIHGGIGFAPYRDRFRTVLPQAATREVYPASEGFVAVSDRAPGRGMRLLLDNGLFFEFVPVAELDGPSPTRHWIGTAEAGVDYALVLTSCAGLWSYVLGDVVRLVETRPPRLLVVGRTAHMLNVFGEHLSGEQIEDAVVAAADGQAVLEYTVGARFPGGGTRGHHVFVIETRYLPPDFAQRLDRALCAGSLDYAERRAAGIGLDTPRVIPVPPGFFTAWMKRRGKLGGQHKVPRVVGEEELERLLQPEAPRHAQPGRDHI
ncbi:MAG TPA: GH3 auxin-responsive promoter family protein [Candidatus Omnitrophota bacterium]|nr:GH3 auxin-responsive promoter family protein [Candidatus Omnitrophota bacterium]